MLYINFLNYLYYYNYEYFKRIASNYYLYNCLFFQILQKFHIYSLYYTTICIEN